MLGWLELVLIDIVVAVVNAICLVVGCLLGHEYCAQQDWKVQDSEVVIFSLDC